MSDTPSLTLSPPEADPLAVGPTPKATARLLGLLLAFFVPTGPAGALRSWSPAVGIAVMPTLTSGTAS